MTNSKTPKQGSRARHRESARSDEKDAVWHEANKRVGFARSEQRLQWLLDFSNKDLSKLTARELKIHGQCLRLLVQNYESEGYLGFLSFDELIGYQRTINDGLAALFDDQKRQWEIPSPKQVLLWRTSSLTSSKTNFQFVMRGDDHAAILYGVVETLQENSRFIRVCSYCRKPILRTKRQEYCSEECSRAQREKNRQDQRERTRLQLLLTKLNVIQQLPPTEPNEKKELADELSRKLKASKTMEEFWKQVNNGTLSVLKRFLAVKGRKRKDFQ